MSLVRAAWERRPEGPAYLLPSVTPLYLAGQCAFFGTHLPPLDPRNSEDFPEFLWFPDLSPPAVISSERDPTVQEAQGGELALWASVEFMDSRWSKGDGIYR